MKLSWIGLFWFTAGLLMAIVDGIRRVVTWCARPGWKAIATEYAVKTVHTKYPKIPLEVLSCHAASLRYAEVDLHNGDTGDLWFVKVYRTGRDLKVSAERYDEVDQRNAESWLKRELRKDSAQWN